VAHTVKNLRPIQWHLCADCGYFSDISKFNHLKKNETNLNLLQHFNRVNNVLNTHALVYVRAQLGRRQYMLKRVVAVTQHGNELSQRNESEKGQMKNAKRLDEHGLIVQ
jgi:hypothetical protein